MASLANMPIYSNEIFDWRFTQLNTTRKRGKRIEKGTCQKESTVSAEDSEGKQSATESQLTSCWHTSTPLIRAKQNSHTKRSKAGKAINRV